MYLHSKTEISRSTCKREGGNRTKTQVDATEDITMSQVIVIRAYGALEDFVYDCARSHL